MCGVCNLGADVYMSTVMHLLTFLLTFGSTTVGGVRQGHHPSLTSFHLSEECIMKVPRDVFLLLL